MRWASRAGLAAAVAAVCLFGTEGEVHAQRGVQVRPDESGTMVNKDVGSERWAITLNEDGTVTGNVFRTDGAPAFVYCEPGEGSGTFACWGADACEDAGGAARGIQRTPDGLRELVNKDVGSERWAISLNDDGTVTGNVFRAAGGPPAFIFCTPEGDAFACSGADACTTEFCSDQFDGIGTVTLPAGFFDVPEPCGAAYSLISDSVTLPDNFFAPPAIIAVTASGGSAVQGFRLLVDYPLEKGELMGSGGGAACESASAPVFLANDPDDGGLLLLAADATPLPLPLEITCAFAENGGTLLGPTDVDVDVLSVTENAAPVDPAGVSVGVEVR